MLLERSDRLIYLKVLGPLVLATVTLVLVSIGGFHALSGARAFVGGESLWSKARSQTVAYLHARASADPPAPPCKPLTEWLAVPLGDRVARLALDQTEPDLVAARAGFLRGGNEADDIDDMISVYLNIGSLPLLRETIAAWRRGDELIEQLRVLGEQMCASTAAQASLGQTEATLRELNRLDAELIDTEKRFSASLGRAARMTKQLLTLATLSLALLLAAGSTWYVMRSLRAQLAQRRALQDAYTRWDLAAGAAGVGVFVWHPGDDVLELDSRARLLFGLAPDPGPASRVPRNDLRARMHPDDRSSLRQLSQSALERNEPLRTRFRILMPDDAVRHIEAIGTRPEGEPVQSSQPMFGVLRDVTDEVATARLQSERDAAERSARARSEFLSRLSHELRTPLNAVLGLAQVLDIDTGEPLTARQRQRVKLILDGGWHLLRLVDDVLDITRIDAGQLSVKLVPTDPRAVLHASLNLIEPERQRCEIRLDDRWPARTPSVMADPQRLQQVFVNLLSNACKYNSRGGTLTLVCRDEPDELCLSFEDDGPGIAADQLAEVFVPFKRLAQTAEEPGTGLGLAVVKLLVEQMGGRIEVTSEPGRGSRFSVHLRKA